MSALAHVQREFMRSLFSTQALEPRLDLYRRNVAANLHDALAATYPVVRRLVGDAFFREASWRFALGHPSTSGDLHLYGEAFAGFLAADPHARELAYLPDVARLEWACHESCHAADSQAFDFAALAAVPAEHHAGLRFVLDQSVRLMQSPFPVGAIWEANQAGRDGTPQRHEGPDRLAVHRVDGAVRVTRLGAEEWDFLHAIAGGAALARASAALPSDATSLGAALTRFVAAGILAGFLLPDEA